VGEDLAFVEQGGGVRTPADVAILMVYLEKLRAQKSHGSVHVKKIGFS